MIKKNQAEEKQQVSKDPYAEPASEYNDLYKQYINLERNFRDAEKMQKNIVERHRKKNMKLNVFKIILTDIKKKTVGHGQEYFCHGVYFLL